MDNVSDEWNNSSRDFRMRNGGGEFRHKRRFSNQGSQQAKIHRYQRRCTMPETDVDHEVAVAMKKIQRIDGTSIYQVCRDAFKCYIESRSDEIGNSVEFIDGRDD